MVVRSWNIRKLMSMADSQMVEKNVGMASRLHEGDLHGEVKENSIWIYLYRVVWKALTERMGVLWAFLIVKSVQY